MGLFHEIPICLQPYYKFQSIDCEICFKFNISVKKGRAIRFNWPRRFFNSVGRILTVYRQIQGCIFFKGDYSIFHPVLKTDILCHLVMKFILVWFFNSLNILAKGSAYEIFIAVILWGNMKKEYLNLENNNKWITDLSGILN